MPKHRDVVQGLVCQCEAEIIKDGRLTCPRCHQSVDMAFESDVKIDERGRWKCQKCPEHGKKPKTLAVRDEIQCRQCGTKNPLIPKEEQKVVENKKRWTKLSCKEARLVLRVTDVDKTIEGSEKRAALAHYMSCGSCKEVGLSKLCDVNLTCQETLEIWAAKPGPLYLGKAHTLREQIAVEHVWGRLLGAGACRESPCTQLRLYWARAPLCSHYDGEEEMAAEIPFIIGIFLEENWPLERLLEIQQQRIKTLLSSLATNSIPPECQGSYCSVDDLKHEIIVNMQALQTMLLDLKTNPKGFQEVYHEITR